MHLDFTSRVVLVTGVAQGIGLAIARAFKDAGAIVHLADIDGPGAQRAADQVGGVAHAVAGLRPELSAAHAYTAAKHAVVGLTRQLSVDLGPGGITVNSVAPGLVLSSAAPRAQWDGWGPERQRQFLQGLHTGRLGTPEDIAAAVLFLASEQAGWITGEVLSVNGGRS